jgi:hypothetical protein
MKKLKYILTLTSIFLFVLIILNQPRSITKNDALIHCEITNMMIFNNLNPYLEENIEKVIPDDFIVSSNKIGTNYLPLVVKSFKIFCHPYVDWVENYKYFLSCIPLLLIIFWNKRFKLANFILLLTGFNGFYQALRSGNISIVSQLLLILFFIQIFKKHYKLASVLFAMLIYIKLTLLPMLILLIFGIKNKKIKEFVTYSALILLFIVAITFVTERELFNTWIQYFNVFSNSENINSFSVFDDIFGNYYDTPSVPNLLHYLLELNLLIFVFFSSLLIFFIFSILKNFLKYPRNEERIILDSFLIYLILNPYFRTYHLIEISIFLCFYFYKQSHNEALLIFLVSIIPQLTLLRFIKVDNVVFEEIFISLYAPLIVVLIAINNYLKNKGIKKETSN